MTVIYLLRHGETTWNQDGNRYAGRTDVPLNDTGRAQAASAAIRLAEIRFTAAYCSPLQRSRETAEIVASAHTLAVTTDPRLFEIDFGTWEGKSRDQIMRDDPAGWERWNTDPTDVPAGGTGETGGSAAARMADFVANHAKGDEIILIVGHNTLNRLYIAQSLGMPLRNYRLLRQSNAGISILEPLAESPWRQINGR